MGFRKSWDSKFSVIGIIELTCQEPTIVAGKKNGVDWFPDGRTSVVVATVMAVLVIAPHVIQPFS
jgi:hypothetical protein